MQLLALAPISQSIDMFIALFFCYLPPILIFIYGWKASRSGSYEKVIDRYGVPQWIERDKNIPFFSTGHFKFGLVWLILGSIFFWLLLWPDHSDVWFVK